MRGRKPQWDSAPKGWPGKDQVSLTIGDYLKIIGYEPEPRPPTHDPESPFIPNDPELDRLHFQAAIAEKMKDEEALKVWSERFNARVLELQTAYDKQMQRQANAKLQKIYMPRAYADMIRDRVHEHKTITLGQTEDQAAENGITIKMLRKIVFEALSEVPDPPKDLRDYLALKESGGWITKSDVFLPSLRMPDLRIIVPQKLVAHAIPAVSAPI
jgi:hypothetical protein